MIEEIGPHRVRVGDLQSGIGDLMHGERADLVYSDPPWGDGNHRYWMTSLRKDTGITVESPGYQAFLDSFFSAALTYGRGTVVVEYGVRWQGALVDIAAAHGLRNVAVAETRYRSGAKYLPMRVLLFRSGPDSPNDGQFAAALEGSYGIDTVQRVICMFAGPGSIVLDPCCGKGLMARATARVGARFRGNEINPKRAAVTIRALRTLEPR